MSPIRGTARGGPAHRDIGHRSLRSPVMRSPKTNPSGAQHI